MSQLYYFIEPTGYNKYVASAAIGMNNAKIFSGFGSKLEAKVFKWHYAWTLNKRTELPFKKYWERRFVKTIPPNCDYILLAESFHISYSKSFLLYLRDTFNKSKICFVFSNPVSDYNLEKIRKNECYYDAILTFSKDDAVKYGFQYCEVLPFRLPEADPNIKVKNDVFFVGANKGRLDTILKIYETLTKQGLKCKFYIVGVPEDEQIPKEEIIYNQRISYEKVLTEIQASRCVLEVLQKGCNYVSMKTCEAIHYHKKLLTTNKYADQSQSYNNQFIRIIKNNDDLDRMFIDKEVPDQIYQDTKLVESYGPLIIYLDNLFSKS